MIHHDRDPSLKTLLIQQTLKQIGLYTGPLDNWHGRGTQEALEAFQQLHAKPPAQELAPDGPRQINQAGIDMVKHFEGLYLKAYLCPAKVWTIGYGHTGLKHKDGTVYAGRTVTKAEAEELLRYDLRVFEERVQRFVKVPLSDNEYAALVSFDFNTGALGRSTLLKKLNAGDRAGAADEFLRWNKAGGRVLNGLTRRRRAERELFLS